MSCNASVARKSDRLPIDDWQKVRFGELASHNRDRADNPEVAGDKTDIGLEHLDLGSLKIE